MIGQSKIKNHTGKTMYHNHLTLSELKDAFPDCGPIVTREIRRLNQELKCYEVCRDKIASSGLSLEIQQYMTLVLKELYMKKDKRFDQLARLKGLQQVMRHEKFGIMEEDIARAKEVDIWSLHDFRNKRGQSASCPFHDDQSPSFAVRRNKWICFGGCGKGDSIDFVMKLENMRWPDAVRYLLEKA